MGLFLLQWFIKMFQWQSKIKTKIANALQCVFCVTLWFSAKNKNVNSEKEIEFVFKLTWLFSINLWTSCCIFQHGISCASQL